MDWQHNNIMRIAEVLEVHPESHSISVRFLDDGTRVPDVPVMSASPSTRSGTVDLPTPEVPEDAEREIDDTEKIYSLAVVAMTSTVPICIGFVYPEVNELAFQNRKNLRLWRHASDVHSIVQDDADAEINHPGGAMIKMGGDGRTNLTGLDYDRKWQIRRNKTSMPTISLVNGLDTLNMLSYIKITPSGYILAHAAHSILADAKKDIRATAGEHVAIKAGLTLTAEAGSDASLSAGGNVAISAGANLSASATATAVVSALHTSVQAATEVVIEAPIIRLRGAVVFEGGGASSPGNFTMAIGGVLTQVAAQILNDTPVHVTTGIHTDANGTHTSATND